MRIVIASTYIPFIEGGGVKIVDDLERELTARGFHTDTVRIDFHPSWLTTPEQTLACVCSTSPSRPATPSTASLPSAPGHALRHPNKVAWFLHHHREAYDLWGTPWGGMPDNDVGRASAT